MCTGENYRLDRAAVGNWQRVIVIDQHHMLGGSAEGDADWIAEREVEFLLWLGRAVIGDRHADGLVFEVAVFPGHYAGHRGEVAAGLGIAVAASDSSGIGQDRRGPAH